MFAKYYILLYSLLMLQELLQDASLRQARLLPPLFQHSAVQSTDTAPFPLIQCIQYSSDVSLASTLDEYSRLLCYSFFFSYQTMIHQMSMEPRSQTPPPSATTRRAPTVLTTGSSQLARTSQVGSQAGGLRLFDLYPPLFVLAILWQNLTNYVCTQILCVYDFEFGSL